MKRAGTEFDQAVFSIITALGDLSTTVTMMLSESEQMTNFTNQQGACSPSRSDDYRYPPYLEQMPCNPISGSRARRLEASS